MGILPIPASLFFNDFSFDILLYQIIANNIIIGTYKGLPNSDEGGNYIGFLVSDSPNIDVGNTISTADNSESYSVIRIEYDRYNGEPELMKAYY